MTTLQTRLPRVLVASPRSTWRTRFLGSMPFLPTSAEVDEAEDACAWLEGRAPGVTFLAIDACGGQMSEAIERLLELHPSEQVVLVVPELDVARCRAAMRAGAFDALDVAHIDEDGLSLVLERAQHRIVQRRGDIRQHQDRIRDAVRRHEREAAARMVDAFRTTGAWSELESKVRRRWLGGYLKAANGPDPAARAVFLKEMAADLAGRDKPGELLVSMHVQAMASGQGLMEFGLLGARELLVDLLVRTAEKRPRGGAVTRAHRSDGDTPGPTLWHRWRWGGGETWVLVREGSLLGLVNVREGKAHGVWRAPKGDEGNARALRSDSLPALPEGLRQVERHVGCGYVLDVTTFEGV